MGKFREIAIYKKKDEAGRPPGKFRASEPMEEKLVYAAELSEGDGMPRRVFGRTLAALARNIALNLEQGDRFRLSRRDANGGTAFAVEESEIKALEHAISHHMERGRPKA